MYDLYLFFSKPKHQSGENFVCPVIMKERGVQACEDTPQQVSYHSVLVLTSTVVCVEVNFPLTEPMYLKEVVEHADN